MNTTFTYSLLQYKHSQILNEVVNIGILCFFPEHHKVFFKYSDRINHLKHIYPAFAKQQIETYLKGFTKKAKSISSHYDFFSEKAIRQNTEEYIHSEFLPIDASALQFSSIYTSLLYSNNLDDIVNNLFAKYFPSHHIESNLEKHDDEYVIRKINSLVKEKNISLTKYFERNIEIKSQETSLVFDIAWKNGSTNLVKPISFDLSNSTNIHRKADRFFGTLFFLEPEAKKQNYRFDLLVAKPQKKSLFKSYDKALKKLEQIPAPKEIIEENKYTEYIDYALNQLTSIQ